MTAASPGDRDGDRGRRFWPDEDGGILIFSLLIFMTMLTFGGLAVDVGHYERTRTRLQTVLDNAVLAAASLSQDLGPRAVVSSYLESAGFEGVDLEVETSEQELGGILVGRTVRATVQGRQPTLFMRMRGQDSLSLGISAEATERVEDIEISLVLDVSGSMGLDEWGNTDYRKINSLKSAATAFVKDVLEEAEENRVSISLVPYSTKVNAGPELLSAYTVTDEHDYSHCVDFEEADYRTTRIDPDQELQRTGHFQFQAWSYSDRDRGQWTCRIDDGFEITPLSQSVSLLSDRIDALSPEGSTSIDMGVKWGVALLDPSAQAPVASLIDAGRIDAAFQGRPRAFDAENTMKVLVIMTDGENDIEFRLKPEYADGPSDVWRMRRTDGSNTYYSLDSPESYYRSDGDRDSDETYFYAKHPFSTSSQIWNDATIYDHPALEDYRHYFEETRLDWPEVWNEMSPIWYGYNLHGRQLDYSYYWSSVAYDIWDDIHTEVDPAEKDDRLEDICAAAKAQGVVVFSIGFEVSSQNSLDLLKQCASTEAHYFDVEGLELDSAFDMIASAISMLRLTK